MIIPIDAEKGFDKFQHPFMIKKNSQQASIQGTELNLIKVIYDKPTTNIIVNAEKLKAFPLRSGTRRQGCPLSPLLLNLVLDVLATAIRYEKEIKGIQIGKEEVKLSLFAEDVILHIENPKDITKKAELSEREIKKTTPFTIASKIIKYLGINLTMYSENCKTLRKEIENNTNK